MTRIQYQKGDIFDSKAHVIVNTVNCKGVMGKGLALAFKQRYPAMFKVYQEECKTGKLRIGRPSLYKQSTPWVLNFPTKNDWRLPSKLEYLEKGLEYFVANYIEAGIKSIAFPKLGAQNGKLSWDEVGPLMVKYLSQLDIAIYIYIADGDREYQYNSEVEKSAWERFSELALSPDGLCRETQLSLKEAKKVAKVREAMEFASQADIDSIDGLAQVTLQRIKKYIHSQRYINAELPGMESENYPCPSNKQETTAPSSRRRKGQTESSLEMLFPAQIIEHVG